ncbi:MAG: ATP synthase F0 subunit B [Candidatus Magasanikbacteria bacterium CG_4_10_14_0_2_um_filter_37_12]|uniref:ATP synthase subunit b n=1 Tax=Candidatus Magasanikbacteria bacterium CG_4_10_14_0_2_um_filter_37_12 TaxID=1974637 RepID=A0A2M7V875_9BACT|nr:MAG: ATP synthase F0 subunit B [Candidatus Magasanikbacteria bacterium CG_4_10_14_0_2_um_filter_37_12]
MSTENKNTIVNTYDQPPLVGAETGPDTPEAYAEVSTRGTAVGDEGLAASLGINAQLFAFQLLNFAVVIVIVWFLILKPLTKTLEKRKKLIDESIDNAKEVETNLKMSEQKFQEKIDESKIESNKIIERAHTEAKEMGEKMKDKAKVDIELLIVQVKKNIKIEKEDALEEVRREATNLIIMATEKILNQKVDSASDKKLIEESLKGLKG